MGGYGNYISFIVYATVSFVHRQLMTVVTEHLVINIINLHIIPFQTLYEKYRRVAQM